MFSKRFQLSGLQMHTLKVPVNKVFQSKIKNQKSKIKNQKSKIGSNARS